jgi:hypothetical protein
MDMGMNRRVLEMLDSDFLAEFKRATEAKWKQQSINPTIYGYQFQRGTRWNPGLSDQQIEEYGAAVGVQFPDDFKVFLRALNGTDLPTLNVYGYCGEPPRQSAGVYSYPSDLAVVQQLAKDVSADRAELATGLAEQGFELPNEARLVPIYGRRYLVCTPRLDTSTVLSIDGADDAMVYGLSLKEYLQREFLNY